MFITVGIEAKEPIPITPGLRSFPGLAGSLTKGRNPVNGNGIP